MKLKTIYLDFKKVLTEERIVEGIATTDAFDAAPGMWKGQIFDGDIVETSAIESALPDYLEWGNIREMHQPSAVGTVVKAEMVQGQLHIAVKVVDDSAWAKVKEGVYKGFSIGGKVLAAIIGKSAGRVVRRITQLLLQEISLVDRPANPDARILVWKGVAMDSEDDLEKTIEAILAKAADPQKAIGQLQQLRNACEMEGDLEGAALYTQSIALVLQASGSAEAPAPEAAEDAAVAEGEGLGEGEEDLALQLSTKATSLKKAGRTFAGKNANAMHGVVKAILEMLAGSGDAVAQKALGAYSAGTAKGAGIKVEVQEHPIDPDAIAGALKKSFEPTFVKVADALKALDSRVDHLERQPTEGGPLLRTGSGAITKSLPAPDKGNGETDLKKKGDSPRVQELRRLAATEPNSELRKQYQAELKAATAA